MMVRVSKDSRRRTIDKHFSLNNKLLNRHFLHVFLLMLIGLSITLYFFLLNIEERGHQQEDLEDNMMRRTAKTAKPLAKGSALRVVAAKEPFILYGTAWKKERTAALVEQAVKSGFRFIDTACQPKHYNEKGVGEGWTKAANDLGLDRHDLFLQSKYTAVSGQDPNNIPYDQHAPVEERVKQSLAISLDNLQTQYLDSWVMHGPEATVEETMKVYRTMESAVAEGKVMHLGISNCYDYDFFTAIYEQARIKPKVLQNRLYKELNFDKELRQFCKENNIWYQSFWTLTANRNALALREVQEWAASKSLTPQTLMYAFLMSLGYVTPLSGTTSLEHMKEDVAVMQRMQEGEKIFANDAELRRFESLLGM